MNQTTRELINGVASAHKLTLNDLIGRDRQRRITTARHEAIYLLKKEKPTLSLAQIGRIFGGRDHTTIIHSIKRHGERHAIVSAGLQS